MDSVISVFSTIWNVSTLLLTNWKYSVAFLFGLYTVAYVVREYTIWKRKRQYEKLGPKRRIYNGPSAAPLPRKDLLQQRKQPESSAFKQPFPPSYQHKPFAASSSTTAASPFVTQPTLRQPFQQQQPSSLLDTTPIQRSKFQNVVQQPGMSPAVFAPPVTSTPSNPFAFRKPTTTMHSSSTFLKKQVDPVTPLPGTFPGMASTSQTLQVQQQRHQRTAMAAKSTGGRNLGDVLLSQASEMEQVAESPMVSSVKESKQPREPRQQDENVPQNYDRQRQPQHPMSSSHGPTETPQQYRFGRESMNLSSSAAKKRGNDSLEENPTYRIWDKQRKKFVYITPRRAPKSTEPHESPRTKRVKSRHEDALSGLSAEHVGYRRPTPLKRKDHDTAGTEEIKVDYSRSQDDGEDQDDGNGMRRSVAPTHHRQKRVLVQGGRRTTVGFGMDEDEEERDGMMEDQQEGEDHDMKTMRSSIFDKTPAKGRVTNMKMMKTAPKSASKLRNEVKFDTSTDMESEDVEEEVPVKRSLLPTMAKPSPRVAIKSNSANTSATPSKPIAGMKSTRNIDEEGLYDKLFDEAYSKSKKKTTSATTTKSTTATTEKKDAFSTSTTAGSASTAALSFGFGSTTSAPKSDKLEVPAKKVDDKPALSFSLPSSTISSIPTTATTAPAEKKPEPTVAPSLFGGLSSSKPAAESAGKSTFSFGAPAASTTTTAAPATAAPAASAFGQFNFGQKPEDKEKPKAVVAEKKEEAPPAPTSVFSGFNFGGPAAATKPVTEEKKEEKKPATVFGFGSTASATPAAEATKPAAPLATTSFGFGTGTGASSSASPFGATATTSSTPATEAPKPAATPATTAPSVTSIMGGFSFGATKPAEPTPTSTITTAPAAPTVTALAGGFSFGQPAAGASKPPLSFGAPATTTTTTTTTAAAPSASSFGFGASASTPATTATPLSITTTESKPAASPYTFGASSSTSSTAPAATTAPLFGAAKPAAPSSASTFGFGSSAAPSAAPSSTPATAAAPSPFAFGSTGATNTAAPPAFGAASTGAPTSIFGSTPSAAGSGAPSLGATSTTGGSMFGASSTTSSSAPVFGSAPTGSTETKPAAPTGGFVFGSTPSAAANSTTPAFGNGFGSGFGSNAAAPAAAPTPAAPAPGPGGFTFGASNNAAAPGAPPSAPGAGGAFGFGQQQQQQQPSSAPFGFGSTPAVNAPAPTPAAPPTSSFTFGANNAAPQSFGFGAQANNPPASAPVFNANPATPSPATPTAPTQGFGFNGVAAQPSQGFNNGFAPGNAFGQQAPAGQPPVFGQQPPTGQPGTPFGQPATPQMPGGGGFNFSAGMPSLQALGNQNMFNMPTGEVRKIARPKGRGKMRR